MNEHVSQNGHSPDLLTVPEAAKLLRISRNLAYELVTRNELPAVRLGRIIRIPRAALDDWIANRAGSSLTDASRDQRDPHQSRLL